MVVLTCCGKVRRKWPTNLILLILYVRHAGTNLLQLIILNYGIQELKVAPRGDFFVFAPRVAYKKFLLIRQDKEILRAYDESCSLHSG